MNTSVRAQNTNNQTRDVTRWGVRQLRGAIPGGSLIPDSIFDSLEEKTVGFVESNEDAKRTLQEGHGFFIDLINSLKDFVLGIVDSKSLNARNAMFKQIGVDNDGKQIPGANPFTAIDAKLGINVSENIQAICEDRIRDDVAGWFGMSTKGAAKTVLAMQSSIEKSIFLALREKHGTKQNAEHLQTVAAAAAKEALGIDDATLTSDDPAYWLIKSPPTTGIAGMIMGTAVAGNGTAVALNLNAAAFDKVAVALKTPQTTQVASAPNLDDKAKKDAQAAAAGNPAAGTGSNTQVAGGPSAVPAKPGNQALTPST